MGKSLRSSTKNPPERLTRPAIFGPPPLIKGEHAANYNELLLRISTAVKPLDIIEEIWVQDIVDLAWEVIRLRRLKGHLFQATVSKGLEEVLNTQLQRSNAIDLAARWAAREADAIEEVKDFLASSGLSMDAVMAQTLVVNIDHIERIDRMIMTAEARRNAVLREINRHRAVLGEKRRRVTHDVEDADFEEVDEKKKRAPQQMETGLGSEARHDKRA